MVVFLNITCRALTALELMKITNNMVDKIIQMMRTVNPARIMDVALGYIARLSQLESQLWPTCLDLNLQSKRYLGTIAHFSKTVRSRQS